MPTVAYITNQFPSPVEPYVVDEILELCRRGVQVITCSARRPGKNLDRGLDQFCRETLYLFPVKPLLLIRAVWFCLCNFELLKHFWQRILTVGREPPSRRLGAVLHTIAGVYYALMLKDRSIEHIHVHHGYFSSWIAMVAARVLGIGFSMTLHGSDLLVHKAYLDTKLKYCRFCVTISEYNRGKLLEQYPAAADKLFINHLGVDVPASPVASRQAPTRSMILLSVGRLHEVKDHAFLIRACRLLKDRGMPLLCLIAGEGLERARLRSLVRELKLDGIVQLLGHVPHQQLESYYRIADAIVLTSRSEGIPLVLMEAMVRGRIVVAPAITGIPELVVHGVTGFLYKPGSFDDLLARLEMIHRLQSGLEPVRRAARQRVIEHFNREQNLSRFAELFLTEVWEHDQYANSLLQQI